MRLTSSSYVSVLCATLLLACSSADDGTSSSSDTTTASSSVAAGGAHAGGNDTGGTAMGGDNSVGGSAMGGTPNGEGGQDTGGMGGLGGDSGGAGGTGGTGGAGGSGPVVITAVSDTCASPVQVPITNGHASIAGDTNGLSDEFADLQCVVSGFETTTAALDGAQAYYEVVGTPDAWYRLRLDSPSSWQYLYVFTNSACTSDAIEADCSSKGVGGDTSRSTIANFEGIVYFQAPPSGSFFFAVDSTNGEDVFTVEVDEITPSDNGTCQNAEPLAFTNGLAHVEADVIPSLHPNEFPPYGPWIFTNPREAPQTYYAFDAAPNTGYRITVTAAAYTYGVRPFVVGSACDVNAIDLAAESGGVNGDVLPWTVSGFTRSIVYTPIQSGPQIIAIDSTEPGYFGSFVLDVEEIPGPMNGDCGGAEPLTFNNDVATVSSSTSLTTASMSDVTCGAAPAISGRDLFYSVDAQAGEVFRVVLNSTYDGAALYAFEQGSCGDDLLVETDCGSNGQTGMFGAVIDLDELGRGYLVAKQATTFIIGVAGQNITEHGDFTLSVRRTATPLVASPFNFDFENSSEALAATGDWEWGLLNFPGSGTSCIVLDDPTSSPGHQRMWGTKLNNCYSGLGNAEGYLQGCQSTVPDNDSMLSVAFEIPANWTGAKLEWRDWFSVDDNNMASFRRVFVNGKSAWGTFPCQAGNGWKTQSVNLDNHVGGLVVVDFHFAAGPAPQFDGAGWYIDEMALVEQ